MSSLFIVSGIISDFLHVFVILVLFLMEWCIILQHCFADYYLNDLEAEVT